MDIDVRRDRYDSIREQNTAVWDQVYLELIENRRFHGFNYLRQDPRTLYKLTFINKPYQECIMPVLRHLQNLLPWLKDSSEANVLSPKSGCSFDMVQVFEGGPAIVTYSEVSGH